MPGSRVNIGNAAVRKHKNKSGTKKKRMMNKGGAVKKGQMQNKNSPVKKPMMNKGGAVKKLTP